MPSPPIVTAGSDTLESVLLFSLRTFTGLDGADLFDSYERAIELGSVPALPYRAALRAQLDDPDRARADVAAFCRRRTEIPGLVDRPELDRMLQATIDERLRTAGKPA